jgi:hypothetical protein
MFSSTDYSLENNLLSLNTWPHIILNGLKCRNPRNKQSTSLTTASIDLAYGDRLLYTLKHAFSGYAINNGNLFSPKVVTAVPSGLCNVGKFIEITKCYNRPIQLIYWSVRQTAEANYREALKARQRIHISNWINYTQFNSRNVPKSTSTIMYRVGGTCCG